jgi:hypothetical protein
MRTTINELMRTKAYQPERKSIFEMSSEELTNRLSPTAERLTKEAWDNNSYIVYFDEKLCPADDIMIHEYRDRKELVRVLGVDNIQVIKVL